jgi:MFS family permease
MTSTRRLTLAIGFTQTLAWATTYYVPATMVGAAADDLGVSRTLLLGGFSLALLVTGLCSPWVGRRIDRLGGRGVLAIASVVTAVGLGLMAASPNVPVWYVAWMITGLGMAMGLYDAAFGTVGRLLGAQARPAIVGVTLLAGFASTLGWPFGTWMVAHVGWRESVALYAVLQIVVILPVTLIFVPRAGAAATAKAVDAAGTPPPPRAFRWLAIYFTLRAAINSVVSVHALVLLAGMGFSPAASVAAATLIGPAQVGSRVLDWFFGRELNPMVAAVVGAVLLPVAALALIGGGPAMVFTLLYGMSNGILTISRGTLPLHVFGASGYAARMGRLAMPAMLASALTPTLIAPLIAIWPAAWVTALLGVVSVMALGCLAMIRR